MPPGRRAPAPRNAQAGRASPAAGTGPGSRAGPRHRTALPTGTAAPEGPPSTGMPAPAASCCSRRDVQEVAGRRMDRATLDALTQLPIAGAGLVQEGRPLGRVGLSSASKKIARSAIALHSAAGACRDVARGVSSRPRPRGHRLPMRNRRRNHATFLRSLAVYPPPSRA